eukprot:sb/3466659/
MSFSNPNPAMPFCKAKRHPGGCLRHPPGQGKMIPRRLGQKVKLHHSQAREVVTLSGTRRLVQESASTFAMVNSTTSPPLSTYSTPYFIPDGINPIAEIACFCFCLICGAVGTIGNAVAFQFFLSRKKDIANVIYIFIALFDLIISILILPASAIFTNNSRGGSLLDNPTFCNIWGLLWYTSTLMSGFAKMYLKKWVLVWVVLFYWVAVTVQGCIPFYMENLEGNDEYSYIPTYGFCTFFTNTFLNGTKGSIYRNIFNFEQYSLIIPILGSSLVTLVILHLPSRRLSRDSMTCQSCSQNVCLTILYNTVFDLNNLAYSLMSYDQFNGARS